MQTSLQSSTLQPILSPYNGLQSYHLKRSTGSFMHSKALSIPIANVDLDGWRNGSNFPFINRSDEISRIRSMVAALVDSLHIAASERREDGSTSVVRHAVDRVSSHIQRMLERNLDPHSFDVRPELVDLLLNDHASDDAVDNIPERDIVAWGTSLAVPLGVAPLDLRRSLHNFLTVCLFVARLLLLLMQHPGFSRIRTMLILPVRDWLHHHQAKGSIYW